MTERDKLLEAIDELRRIVTEQGDATRNHVSAGIDSVANDTKLAKERIYDMEKEQRGQLTAIKERVQYLIKILDGWLHGKKPPDSR